jgi:excisionase family DNA binding protein
VPIISQVDTILILPGDVQAAPSGGILRKHHDIAVYREGEWAERGEITLEAAAQTIGVTKMTAARMIRRGDLKGRQVCKGAPWVIKAEDVAAFAARKRSSGSVTLNPVQQTFQFQ